MLDEAEVLVVPAGLEHRPVADEGEILLFELRETTNKGNVESEETEES